VQRLEWLRQIDGVLRVKKSRARSARRLPDLVSYFSSVPFCVRPPGEPPDL